MMSNYSICHNVFKGRLLQRHYEMSEGGKGISLFRRVWVLLLLLHFGFQLNTKVYLNVKIWGYTSCSSSEVTSITPVSVGRHLRF